MHQPTPRMSVRVALVLAMLVMIPWSRPAHGDPKVGVYYYPWYGSFAGGHTVTQSLRGHLVPAQWPVLGEYSNRDSATVTAHLEQSRQGNIDFWALSWWGPSSAEDRTIRNSILTNLPAGELEYAIHYESTGRFGPFDSPNYSALIPDFRHLADNYFWRDDYLHIDGRPVVFLYVTRAYFNSAPARAAIAALRQTMQSEYGYDPYLIGDDVFAGPIDLQRARLWDAITDFDVYGTALQANGSTNTALHALAGVYDNALAAAAGLGIGFVPTATPGFNDSGVRTGHPAAPRYLTDVASQPGDLFSRMLTDVVLPRTDVRVDNVLMINSFNEWHEDTQIEPARPAPPTDQDDSGAQYFTQGYFYEGYGSRYLDLLRDTTVRLGDVNRDGAVNGLDVNPFVTVSLAGPYRSQADMNGDGEVNGLDVGPFVAAVIHGHAVAAATSAVAPEPPSGVLAILGLLTLVRLRTAKE